MQLDHTRTHTRTVTRTTQRGWPGPPSGPMAGPWRPKSEVPATKLRFATSNVVRWSSSHAKDRLPDHAHTLWDSSLPMYRAPRPLIPPTQAFYRLLAAINLPAQSSRRRLPAESTLRVQNVSLSHPVWPRRAAQTHRQLWVLMRDDGRPRRWR